MTTTLNPDQAKELRHAALWTIIDTDLDRLRKQLDDYVTPIDPHPMTLIDARDQARAILRVLDAAVASEAVQA